MKQLTAPIKGILSANAYRKYEEYCKKKDWGTTIDGEFIEWMQLSIGQLIEILLDYIELPLNILVWEKLARVESVEKEELIDALVALFKDALEETN